ncbi:MAG: hypothetical protein HAW67_03110 [Endozoicomonadaceae bacterium]|nr:hypothetical protein [Endozoicomonadaceae bacterium]
MNKVTSSNSPIKSVNLESSEAEILSYLLNYDNDSIPIGNSELSSNDKYKLESTANLILYYDFNDKVVSSRIDQAVDIINRHNERLDLEENGEYLYFKTVIENKNKELIELLIDSINFEDELSKYAVLTAVEKNWLYGYDKLIDNIDADDFFKYLEYYSYEQLDSDSMDEAISNNSLELMQAIIDNGFEVSLDSLPYPSVNCNLQTLSFLQSKILDAMKSVTQKSVIMASMTDPELFSLYLNSNDPKFTGSNSINISLSNMKQAGMLQPIELGEVLKLATRENVYQRAMECLQSDYQFQFEDLMRAFINVGCKDAVELQVKICEKLLVHESATDEYIAEHKGNDLRIVDITNIELRTLNR